MSGSLDPSRVPGKPCSLSINASLLQVVGTVHTRTGVRRLIRSVTQGLRACQEPEAAEAGLGGTYFFKNEAGRKIGIVKPIDEEPLAPNNPKVRWRL